MELPSRAIFAFNANIDHHCFPTEGELKRIGDFAPLLASQIDECFAYGMQREVQIDIKACNFLLSEFGGARKMVGGQAGNAAQAASALGVECFLHSNYASEGMLRLFSHPKKVMVAKEDGFSPADTVQNEKSDAHHFVFESAEARTRFIASYDPQPLHPDSLFCEKIRDAAPSVRHAFIGGFHLLPTVGRLGKFLDELRAWKRINPSMHLFCELGEFSKPEVRDAFLEELMLFDMVGLNDTELSSFGMDLEEFASRANSVLFHSQGAQEVLPKEKLDGEALQFARRCASFRAENGRCAALSDIEAYGEKTVESPVETVGLGDTLSCAYFLACRK
ncbi:MAG: ADP-dependent glucokinase/phosphofructokinase [Candidatus Micrarchaeia archaeon]|jgi:ADP-dependent phosphofructokinase/glucokinase